MIETLEDIVEEVANNVGVYGAHAEVHPDGQCECRVCFTMDLTARIRAAMELEAKLSPDNTPIRMHIALQILRACRTTIEACRLPDARKTVFDWIDGGMEGPIPWPASKPFQEWLNQRGYANVNGSIGFRFTVPITEVAK